MISTITKPYTFTNITETANATKVNQDFDVAYAGINDAIGAINTASGTKSNLNLRLSTALNDDGSIKADALPEGTYDSRRVRKVTTNTTMAVDDSIIMADTTSGAITVTLLDSESTTNSIKIVNIGTTNKAVTILPAGSNTIAGLASLSTAIGGQSITLAPNGTNWVRTDIAQLPTGKRININGNFSIWQDGTSFTSVGYCADMFKIAALGTGGAATVSQQSFTLGQTDVPGEPKYFLRWNQTTQASSSPQLLHIAAEGVRSLAGKYVTVSFYTKYTGGAVTLPSVVLRQYFGTGSNSPSANVDTQLAASVALTTGMLRYSATVLCPSITGKTIGNNYNDYLGVLINFPTGQTFTVDIASIKVEEGTVATDQDIWDYDVELRKCQRFYEKSYNPDVTPGTNTTVGILRLATYAESTTSWVAVAVPLKVTKRATLSTVTVYRDTGTQGISINASAGQTTPASNGINYSCNSFCIGATTTGLTPNTPGDIQFHYVADARL